MMKIPEASEFSGKGKIPERLTQNEYLNLIEVNGCANCHSQGVLAMRTFPKDVPDPLGKFANSIEACFRRIQSGQGGNPCSRRLSESSVPQLSLISLTTRTASPSVVAPCEAAAAAGCRAQHCRHHLGLARR